MTEVLKILLGLIPVLFFLASLIVLDSYKLVKLKSVFTTIVVGCLTALLSMVVNNGVVTFFSVESTVFQRYVAPFVEEFIKCVFLIYLIRSCRVGFMVDAAIRGFAIGAGFALVENIYYWMALDSTQVSLWIVRGFGTAAIHGGTMTIFGIISKNLHERKQSWGLLVFLPGFAMAVVLHSLFNHFILPPLMSTGVVIVFFTVLISIVFYQSEKATRHWLGAGLDADMKLYQAITGGKIMDFRIGQYLETLNDKFSVSDVADMLGLIKVHLELALRTKGLLLMRSADLTPGEDKEIIELFDEMKDFKKRIGITGQLAIQPYLQTSSRDLWQIYYLAKNK